ncbi:hypothetical protein KKF84_09410 [Myxococcota bacterium]|nr:hypothetical protein [Myxococcota bacterium]MBU1535527.1 hypothetical protein [Myxococcota bacterium]
MGFFNKLFGGEKSKSGEIEVVTEEVVDKKKKRKEKEHSTEEESSSKEPELQKEKVTEEHKESKPAEKPQAKATVFGMPAPQGIVQPSEKRDPAPVSGELGSVSGELGSSSGELGAPETSNNQRAVVSGELGSVNEEGLPEPQENDETEQMSAGEPMEATEGVPDEEPKSVLNILRGPDLSDDDLFGGGSGKIVPKEAKKASLSSSVECASCSRRLPVPFPGYPAKITCPFCLRINEYQA